MNLLPFFYFFLQIEEYIDNLVDSLLENFKTLPFLSHPIEVYKEFFKGVLKIIFDAIKKVVP
jgi:hypothetical protein